MKLFISISANQKSGLTDVVSTQPLEIADSTKAEMQKWAKEHSCTLAKWSEGTSPNSMDEAVFKGPALNVLKLLAEYDSSMSIKELMDFLA